MNLSRRMLLSGASAAAATAWLAACSNRSMPDAAAIERILATHFGDAVAGSEPAREFAAAYAPLLAAEPPCSTPWSGCETLDAYVVRAFLTSTTFIDHYINGASFDHVAVFHPYSTVCASQLVLPA